jgi:NitT/TauT family transport system ATP-binding protein
VTAQNLTPAPGAADATALISVRGLSKSFAGQGGRAIGVLEDINLEVAEGEFVALLGRSGSGKSTLLRCIAGLIPPTSGQVRFRGAVLTGSNRETTMVFQTFALLPWLTVQQNVELGLEARGVPPAARAERALRAIDIVGLDGYESAYPKELSGGMRQRVGFARALVVEPAALLMDEPFSALDVLTSENLRGELLELWEGQRFPTKTLVMVTHNIEEAVLLADRILVLGTNPGRIRFDLRNPLPRPRRRRTPDFEALVDQIYRIMTQRDAAPDGPLAGRAAGPRGTVSDTPLPLATVDGLSGLAEVMLGRHGGAADLADLADGLGLEVDDLLPLVDALVLLGFAELHDDRLQLSAAGRVFAGASIQDSKEIFARACLDRAPLVRTIYRALQGSLDGTLPAGFFTDILRTSFGEQDSAQQLDVAVNWGRYAELYAFDAARDEVIREDQGIGAALAARAAPRRRGSLVVYLGAAPGSGKTFTMLREGRALRSQDEDVVIGYADTRGRPRTREAVGKLEIVPRTGPGAGDLDTAAVLARRPAVALVDDLGAHAGAIDTLRAAGIDVISTADVADVARVAAAVTEITGRPAPATVTDEMLAGAEIQFVDSSPEALRARLGHGNIYPPDQAAAALRGDFQTARLAALREIGLRLVAGTLPAGEPGRVRPPQDVLAVLAGSGRTGPGRAQAVAQHGLRLARRGGAGCVILALGGVGLPDAAGASDAVVLERDGDPVTAIPQAVVQTGARHLVLAAPPGALLDRVRGSLLERLAAQLPDVHLHVLPPPLPFPGETAGPQSRPAGEHPAGTQPAGTQSAGTQSAGTGPAGTQPTRDGAGRRPAAVRVYLGYARGCGTTSAMLEEAGRRRSRGADVVVATADPRGREDVAALLDGLERIGDGTALDPDAVLARRPEVVCVDDVARPATTGEGGLAAARRLADAGIAVVATEHLGPERDDARDDAVLLALADELELVDVAPSALIERLRRGELGPGGPAAEALAADAVLAGDAGSAGDAVLAGDYSPAALAARREHAFRLVAEHAERRLAGYRDGGPAAGDDRPPRILACVAPRPGLEPLLRRAAALAAHVDGEFLAAAVDPGDGATALLSGYAALAAQLGGRLDVLSGGRPAVALARYAREHQATELILGRDELRHPGRYPVLRELAARPADLELHVLPAEP